MPSTLQLYTIVHTMNTNNNVVLPIIVHTFSKTRGGIMHITEISISSQQNAEVTTAPKKVFVQRDYTHGTECKFETNYPSQLEGVVCKMSTKKLMFLDERLSN